MLRTLALCALFGLLLDTPALAQDDPAVRAHLDSAVASAQSGDLDRAAAQTEQAIAIAQSLPDRFNGLYLLAQIRQAQARHGEAAILAERAAELIRAEALDDKTALQSALELASQAYFNADDRDNWFRVGTLLQEMVNADLALFWHDLDGNPEHVFSAAHCPTRLGPAVRTYISNLNATGTDVQCQYVFGDIPAPRISVFMSRITTVSTLDALYDGTVRQIDTAFEHPRRISTDTLDPNGFPVRRGIFAQGATRTGVWLSLVHGWSLKLRLTHDGEVTADQVNAVADALFSDLPGIDAKLAQCAALADGPDASEASPGFADALMLQAMFETAESAADAQCFLGLPDFNSGDGTLAWSDLDADGGVLRYVAANRDGSSNYRVILGHGLLPIQEGGAAYILASRNDDGMFLLGAFDALPSPQQFIDYAQRAAAGQLTSFGSVVVDQNGDSQITVGDALLESSQSGPN